MDVKYLNYVLTIAKEKNLHRAAKKLFISQPSLSQFLTRLEKEIGTPLFERKSKELVLTEAGRLYVETAQVVVSLKNQLYRDISNLIYQNHLSIATTSQWGMRLVSQLLPEFNRDHPTVMVEITESFLPSMSQRLRNREVDICLASTPSSDTHLDANYEIVPLGEEEIFLAVSKHNPFCLDHDPASTSITMDTLRQFFSNSSFLLTTKGSTTQTLIEALFQESQFHPRISGYFDNILTILHMVEEGPSISFSPDSCIRQDLDINYYHLNPPVHRQHILAYRKGLTMTPVLKDFLTTVTNTYNKLYLEAIQSKTK